MQVMHANKYQWIIKHNRINLVSPFLSQNMTKIINRERNTEKEMEEHKNEYPYI